MLVTPKVAGLMGLRGLGDYCVVQSNGARICYSGTAPGTPAPAPAANLPYPNGSLLSSTADPTGAVFLISNGQKVAFPDQNTLYAMGYSWAQVLQVSPSVLALYPSGGLLASLDPSSGNVPKPTTLTPVPNANAAYTGIYTPPAVTPVPVSTATTTTTTAAATAAPVYNSVWESGAVYNAANNTWTNPDGTIYIPPASGQLSPYLETGAVYNAATGYYTNPDGTLYEATASAAASVATTASGTIDISSPSTWPLWLWLALGVGGTWLLFFKKK